MKKQVYNPVLPNYEYIPDVEPRIFNGRLYLYGSHDRFGGEECCMNDYVCWSATVDDLSDWKYEGIIWKVKDDTENIDHSQLGYAPDVVQGADGKYYLFYCLSGSKVVSVAVCDTPAGAYEFYGYVKYQDGTKLGSQKGDPYGFDPGVLIDEDGTVWLYVGFGLTGAFKQKLLVEGNVTDGCYCIQLEADMITVRKKAQFIIPSSEVAKGTTFEGYAFFEASSPRKINGKYYLIYSFEKSHSLCYAVSNYPDQNFTFGGVLISNGDIGLPGSETQACASNNIGNIHGGMFELHGQWYIFYHRQTDLCRFSRQCCAEPIFFDGNGNISQVEMTSCGLNGENLRGIGTYGAYIACCLKGKEGTAFYRDHRDTNTKLPYFTQDGEDWENIENQYIANLRHGSEAGYKYFDFKVNQPHKIKITYRGTFQGKIKIHTNCNKMFVGEVIVEPSTDWTEVEGNIHVDGEKTALYFTINGEGIMDFMGFGLY